MTTPPPPPAGPRLAQASRLGWAGFLFAFGLVLASYPARNPDVWGHLAAGREAWSAQRLAETVTPLFDLLLYAGDALGGGPLLVGVKAVAIGLLGVALFEAARGPAGRLVPAAVVGLALLPVSLRANLQPQAATYLLLGLAALWLRRHPDPPTLRAWWPLAAGFVAWANLDGGVVYGLAAVALALLGRCLDAPKLSAAPWGRVALLVAALVVASSLNPARPFGAFPVPAELLPFGFAKSAEVARSPLGVAYVRAVADSPAALAYYPLLALGVVGVAVNGRGFRWERVGVGAAFGLLSVLTDRAVPLFAVVAAPATALNLSEALAARRGRHPTGRWVRVVPLLPALAAASFLAAAWPGWLQRPPYEPRRWAYDLPTAPAAAAEPLRALGAGRTLYLSPESRAAFRWFCPSEDGVDDPSLTAELVGGKPVEAALRAAGVTRVVVYSPGLERSKPALNVLLRDRHRWPLLYLGGDAAVFGWRDPARDGEPTAGGDIDLSQLWQAGLDAGRTPVPLGETAAAEPSRWESVRAAWTTPRVVHSQDRDEAALLLAVAELSQRWVPQLNGLSWYFEQSAGLAGGAAGWANPVSAAADAALRLNGLQPPTPSSSGAGPPPLLRTVEGLFNYALASKDDYLSGALAAAIRAGRRAVAADPNDPRAHLILGEAYLMVWLSSGERVGGAELKQLRELRQAQAVAALERAVRLSPAPSARAHRLLSVVYRQVGFLDLALEHLGEARQAERRNAPGAKPDPDAEADFERLRERVALLRGRFEKESVGQRGGDQAALAADLGLNGKSLDLLLKSDISAFGAAGLRLQLEQMVRTGQGRLVTEWTSPGQLAALGPRSYHWLRAQAFAGLGDYDAADSELVEIGGGPGDLVPDPALLAASAAAAAAKNVLGEATLGSALPDAVRRALARTESATEWQSVESRLKNLAEVSLLRGVLALEVGDRPAARRHGRAVLFFALPGSAGTTPLLRATGEGVLNRARDPDAPRP